MEHCANYRIDCFSSFTQKRKQNISDSIPAKTTPDNAEISQVQVSDLNASSTSAQLSTQSFQSSPKRSANVIEDYLNKNQWF